MSVNEPGAGVNRSRPGTIHLSKSEGGSCEDGESALGARGGARAPYLDAGAGGAPQAAKSVFKKGLCGRAYFWLWQAGVFLLLRCCWLWGREERGRWAASSGSSGGVGPSPVLALGSPTPSLRCAS